MKQGHDCDLMDLVLIPACLLNPLNEYPKGFTVILQLIIVLKSRWQIAVIWMLICGAKNKTIIVWMTLFYA